MADENEVHSNNDPTTVQLTDLSNSNQANITENITQTSTQITNIAGIISKEILIPSNHPSDEQLCSNIYNNETVLANGPQEIILENIYNQEISLISENGTSLIADNEANSEKNVNIFFGESRIVTEPNILHVKKRLVILERIR